MAPDESSADRRAQIVEAMIETMADHGYAKATISRIAERAGLTPGLLHYHFQNKQMILLGVLDRLAEAQLLAMRHFVDGADEPDAALRELLTMLLAPGDSARPDEVSAWVGVLAESVRQPEVERALTRWMEEFRAVLVDLLKQGVESGDFDLGDYSDEGDEGAEAAAAGLLALVQGYFTMGVTSRGVVPRGSALAVALRMADGLTARGG